jgi:hypothetical protein
MDTLEFEFHHAGRVRRASVNSTTVVIGRSKKCDLVIPLPWVAERHFIVQEDPPFLRAKAIDSSAEAMIGNTPMGHGWQKLAEGAAVTIRGPGRESLVIRIGRADPNRRVSVVKDSSAQRPGSSDFGFMMVTESPVAGGGGWAQAADDDNMDVPLPTSLPPVGQEAPALKSMKKPLAWTAAGVCAMIIGALAFNAHRASARRSAMGNDCDAIHVSLDNIAQFQAKKNYVAAKAELDKARALAGKWPSLEGEQRELDSIAATPEITYGGQGFEFVDGKWLAPDKARLHRETAARIESIQQQVGTTFDAGQFEQCGRLCEQQLKLISAAPGEFREASDRARQRLAQIKSSAEKRDSAAQKAADDRDGLAQQQAKAEGDRKRQSGSAPPATAPLQVATPAAGVPASGVPASPAVAVTPAAAALMDAVFLKGKVIILSHLDRPETAKFLVRSDPQVYMDFRKTWYVIKMPVEFTDSNGRTQRQIARCRLRPKPGSSEWESGWSLKPD